MSFWSEILMRRKFQIKLLIDSRRKKLMNSINHIRGKRAKEERAATH